MARVVKSLGCNQIVNIMRLITQTVHFYTITFVHSQNSIYTGINPPVIMESTGHYHMPVVQYLEGRHYLLIIVNPFISYRAKSSSFRKVKTDLIDASHLCEMYYKEDLEPYKKRGIQLLNLRNLTKQHENITGRSLHRQSFNLSEDILQASEQKLTDTINRLCKSRSLKWAGEKSEELKAAARNPF